MTLDDTIAKWYSINSHRKVVQPMLVKMLTKITKDPSNTKFRNINFNKLFELKIFQDANVRASTQNEWFNLLYHAGFTIKKNDKNESRLLINDNEINDKLKYINKVLFYLSEEYEKEFKQKKKEKNIQKNKERLNTKEKQKEKETIDKIRQNYNYQKKMASKGIYDVKRSVGDRKGGCK